jgi:hypothetical protein
MPGCISKNKADFKNMEMVLQAWGGGFYLVNKILFAMAEGRRGREAKSFKLFGWMVYITGVPAWVIILVMHHDWIAASIEAGGLPAMVFGFYNVWKDKKVPDRGWDRVVSWITYGFLVLGIGYSIMDYGGITSVSQWLEICVVTGFLIGSYLLAKNNSNGWLFFILMNAGMGTLMLMQNKPLLFGQQMVSLCFGIYGFTAFKKSLRQWDNLN